ncbi:hypothetical protein X975_07266, partial [Stegodyphus mimosarum]
GETSIWELSPLVRSARQKQKREPLDVVCNCNGGHLSINQTNVLFNKLDRKKNYSLPPLQGQVRAVPLCETAKSFSSRPQHNNTSDSKISVFRR